MCGNTDKSVCKSPCFHVSWLIFSLAFGATMFGFSVANKESVSFDYVLVPGVIYALLALFFIILGSCRSGYCHCIESGSTNEVNQNEEEEEEKRCKCKMEWNHLFLALGIGLALGAGSGLGAGYAFQKSNWYKMLIPYPRNPIYCDQLIDPCVPAPARVEQQSVAFRFVENAYVNFSVPASGAFKDPNPKYAVDESLGRDLLCVAPIVTPKCTNSYYFAVQRECCKLPRYPEEIIFSFGNKNYTNVIKDIDFSPCKNHWPKNNGYGYMAFRHHKEIEELAVNSVSFAWQSNTFEYSTTGKKRWALQWSQNSPWSLHEQSIQEAMIIYFLFPIIWGILSVFACCISRCECVKNRYGKLKDEHSGTDPTQIENDQEANNNQEAKDNQEAKNDQEAKDDQKVTSASAV